MQGKKTLLIGQVPISAMTAFLMTGYATAPNSGFGPDVVPKMADQVCDDLARGLCPVVAGRSGDLPARGTADQAAV